MRKIITIAALALASFAATAAQDASVRIINESGTTIVKIQTSPTYASRYGDTDLLGSGVIRSGYNRWVDFDVYDAQNECVQDVRATGSDGRKWEWRMNVCRQMSWTLNP